MLNTNDTIAAVITPSGRGGVGIIRVSGPLCDAIIKKSCQRVLRPRVAYHLSLKNDSGDPIDSGLALYFKAPRSFTGEDVFEFQGHGGPFILNTILERMLSLGARLAEPGEFSLRAYLNNKIDLVQAEAISDLINATTEDAASAATQSLQGTFSRLIEGLLKTLIQLRIQVEACIDFPDEELIFYDTAIRGGLIDLIAQVTETIERAHHGQILQAGIKALIIGSPNAGKSSLLNRLNREEVAIVTETPGTTRDVIQTQITLGGIACQLLDTAGLRETFDHIERKGIERAVDHLKQAQHVFLVVDAEFNREASPQELLGSWFQHLPPNVPLTVVMNKIDRIPQPPRIVHCGSYDLVYLSALTGEGLELIEEAFKAAHRLSASVGLFSARTRHLEALRHVLSALVQAQSVYQEQRGFELVAEDLKVAQNALSEITGQFTSDELLGRIFSEFCIGK